MIKRVVKMVFREAEVEKFQSVFEERKNLIRQRSGCSHLQLLQDSEDHRIHFTISHWDSDEDLQDYRKSELFRETWKVTKSLFEERAQAWSLELISQPTSVS